MNWMVILGSIAGVMAGISCFALGFWCGFSVKDEFSEAIEDLPRKVQEKLPSKPLETYRPSQDKLRAMSAEGDLETYYDWEDEVSQYD